MTQLYTNEAAKKHLASYLMDKMEITEGRVPTDPTIATVILRLGCKEVFSFSIDMKNGEVTFDESWRYTK